MSAADAPTTKKPFFRRKKSCPFSGPNAPTIDWKDVKLLSRFVSERGKMTPSRITNVSQKKQRELAQAIKRARYMALMPYVRAEGGSEGRFERGDRGDRFERGDRGGERFDRGDRGDRAPRTER